MKNPYLIKAVSILAAVIFYSNNTYAQLVSCNVFLQGNRIEVGINTTGAYGSSVAAPSGYHPRSGSAGTLQNICSGGACTSTNILGFVADPNATGWNPSTTGTGYYGDYFTPGEPQEGWSIECNNHESDAWNNEDNCGVTTAYTGGMTGANVSYSSAGAVRSGTWQGTNSDGLQITQVTSLDTGNVFFTVHVTLRNTTAATVNNVYYGRTVDPDNDETLSGGMFQTTNTIVYQLPNTLGATLVSATGTVFTNVYLGLGTLDCRARCYYINTNTLAPTVSLDSLYNELTTTVNYTSTLSLDGGIGLVFSLGNIPAGDSVTFAYAYILKASDLLEALQSTVSTWAATGDTASAILSKDTADVCQNTLTTVSLQDTGTTTWSWISLTGETLSTYTGTHTQVTTGTTLIRLMAIGLGSGCAGANDTVYIYLKPTAVPAAEASSNSPVCLGSTLNLTTTDTTSGTTYLWTGPGSYTSTARDPSIAGVTAGEAGTYHLSETINGCPADTTSTPVTVSTVTPAAISPATATICPGSTVSLIETTTGGVWSSSNTGIATVSGGVAGAVLNGVDTITYAIGGCTATATVTVNSTVSAITPATAVTICLGSTVTLADGTTGGTWSSGATGIATVSSGGVVDGVGIGTAVITYTAGGCVATKIVTVTGAPSPITGNTTVCAGALDTLYGAGGGIWSSSNTAVVTVVSATGVLTGVAPGTTTITYTIGTGCTVTTTVTVNANPTPPSVGISCVGSTGILAAIPSGGTWISGNTAVATIVSGTGALTGVSGGTSTITYTLEGCFATSVLTVIASSPISPATSFVCIGGSETLTETGATGLISGSITGAWISSNTALATVSAGTVSGISSGTDTISYEIFDAGALLCSYTATVNVTSGAGTITPSAAVTVCSGSTATLADATSGGVWSSGNTAAATVSSSGVVSGVAAGTATIIYSVGSCTTSKVVTVTAGPAAIATPYPIVCTGSTNSLTDATTGGVWSSGNTSLATMSGNVIYGVTPGTDTISYTVGSCAATAVITVYSTPAAITPLGTVTLCGGTSVTLSDATSGGSWASSATSVATVSPTGAVYGVSAGGIAVYYSISGCLVTESVVVDQSPAAISPATATACAGTTVSLTETTTGGTWSSSATGTATVGATGIVSGVAAGTATIDYTLGSCTATAIVTVANTPAAITPSTAVAFCPGTTITLVESVTGGSWSSNATSVATVSAAGVVSGVTAGTATISYISGSCYVTKAVTVSPGPAALSPSSATVCSGTTVTLTETTTGGAWSSSATGTATVTSGGAVNGVAAGTSTIAYTLGSCSATAVVTVANTPAAITPSTAVIFCSSTTTTLVESVTGGAWSSNAMGVATVSAGGIVTGVSGGTANISYISGSCNVTKTVTVSPGPAALSPASPILCTGNTLTLTDAVSGGSWSSSSTSIATLSATGTIGGIAAGTEYILYTIGSCTATDTITVVEAPVVDPLSGATSLCVGTSTSLTEAATGGAWTSSNLAAATVTGAGIVYGAGVGTAAISYTITSSCGVVAAGQVMTVNTSPSAGFISGASNICAGTLTSFTSTAGDGTWSSSNGSAGVNATTGEVTGISPGTDTIIYTVTTPCGTASTSKIITIGTYLSAGTISGGALLCGGTTVSLTDLTTGGTWSSSNSSATVGSTGIVTGSLAGGMDTIIYTITASCGIATSTHIVDVAPAAVSGSISGVSVICVGSSATFTETATSGAWSSHNSNATITGGGLVLGVTAGTDIISYTVTNSCGTSFTTVNITIGGTVTAGTISGPGSVCAGAPVTLTDAVSGGVWSSSNTNVAVSSGGLVTSTGLGLDTISYTITTACGTATATFTISADGSVPTAGTISGPSGVCVGYPITFTDAIPLGVWSMSNGNATISPAGSVSGVLTGTDTIIYTVTTSCGTATATLSVTTGTSAGAGSISGASVVCVGSSITLTDGVGSGTWSSSNTSATVSGGAVTGVSAGTAIISYFVTYSCGLTYATEDITVNPSSGTSSIAGADTVCIGSTITLTDASTGGVWSSGNTNVTVSGGVVTGVATGTSPVSYTVSSSCGTSTAVSVITIVAGSSITLAPISGISIVCVGSGITLTDATSGGIWVASNGHAAVVGAGIIDGISRGVDTIGYLVTGVCGNVEVTKILNVDTIPSVAPIAGPASQCIGTTITLTDPTTGGVWTTSTPTVGTVSVSTGVVTGLSTGTTTITYTVTNAFGCPGSETLTDAVTPATVTTGITGSAGVCAGATVTLSNATTGGTWSGSNTAVAVINPVTGVVTGIAPGTATISYTVVNSCGTSTVTSEEIVNGLPSVLPISGSPTGCTGSSVVLTDATSGGVWSSSNTAIATVNAATGAVTGVTVGAVTINYTVTSVSGCSVSVGASVFINPAPAIDAISGTAIECAGSSAAVADGTTGGVWSSSNTAIATVNTSGHVSGILPGTAVISYTVSTGGGCPGIATVTDIVNTVPVESPITGVLHVCAGATTALGNSIGGGVWSSVHTSIAIVDATGGVVAGISAGTDVIYYSVSNSCGSALDSASIVVYSSPSVGAITAAYTSVCTGDMLDVSDAVSGGIWGSTNTAIASISSAGAVLGTAAGTDTIYYVVTNSHGCSSAAIISITVGGTITSATVAPVGTIEMCKGHTEYMHVTSAGGVTYQWLRNAGIIAGATTSSYTTSATGNYAVVVSNGICSETVAGPSVIAPPAPVVSFTAPDVLYTGSYVSYQWFRNGVLITGATGSVLDEAQGGVYTVVVTDANGCSDTSSGYTYGGATGVNSIGIGQDIKVYPNPATSVVHIDAPEQVNVSVLSIDGKALIEQKDATNVDVSNLADGMYMILVYDQGGLLVKTVKFAKME